MIAKKLYYTDCHLAGRKYYDADEVWEKLKVGTLLHLEWDSSNTHDDNAVAVFYIDPDVPGDDGRYMLGYLPCSHNVVVAALLKMGWTQVMECRISKLDADAHPEAQVRLTLRIKRNGALEK